MNSSNVIRFFTYGTFRNGECRHHILQKFHPKFIRVTSTLPKYKMIHLGSFPGLKKNGNKSIIGELYLISAEALAVFDMIESHPLFFNREQIELEDGNNAIAYFYNHEINCDEIASGDWLEK